MAHEWVVEGGFCRYRPLNDLVFVITRTMPLGEVLCKKWVVSDDPPRFLEIFVLVRESKSTTIEVCSGELKGGDELEHFFT